MEFVCGAVFEHALRYTGKRFVKSLGRTNMTRIACLYAFLTAAVVFSGCASSRVHFEEPAGTRMILNPRGAQMKGPEFTFPVAIDLPQKENPEELENNLGGRPVRLSLPDGTVLKGFLYVYKLDMDQVEKLAEVTFRLTDEQVEKLRSGHAVTLVGYSAQKRPVYKMNLGLDR